MIAGREPLNRTTAVGIRELQILYAGFIGREEYALAVRRPYRRPVIPFESQSCWSASNGVIDPNIVCAAWTKNQKHNLALIRRQTRRTIRAERSPSYRLCCSFLSVQP